MSHLEELLLRASNRGWANKAHLAEMLDALSELKKQVPTPTPQEEERQQ